ncbi:MAG: hypothetical protein AAFQ64_09825 [Pseudomonadota bacterium]
MTVIDRTTHGANALVCIAGCLTAADTATTGGTGMAAVLSLREIFRRGTKPPQAIYTRTKVALDQELDAAHLTPADRDKIHYAIEEGCPSREMVIALGRNPQAIATDMAAALDKTDADAVLRDTFISIVATVLQKTLDDPDSATELASAFQKALLEKTDQIDGTTRRTEEKVDVLSDQLAAFLAAQGFMEDGTKVANVADLITLAAKFEETTITDPATLVQFLTQKAEEYRSYKTLIDNIDDRIAAVANLKAAAQDAADKLNFDEVEELLSRVDEVETEIAVGTKEARASNALLRNRAEEAYRIFTSAAEALAGVDPIAAAKRRNTYRRQLYEHGLRYGGVGFDLSAQMIRPAIATLADTDNQTDWAAYTQNLALALQNQGIRAAGAAGTALMAEAVAAYRDALTVRTRDAHPVDWAMSTQNLAITLEIQGTRTAGEAGTALLAQAVTAYRNALTVRTCDAEPVRWAQTTQNLAGALQEQGIRTAGEAGIALLAEAVTAYRDALTVRTRDAHPVDWAMTTQNLALALQNQGTRTAGEAGTALLAEAVAAYRDALTVRTRDAEPVQWAMTTQNLAIALKEQGSRTAGEAGTDLLAEAVTAYRDVLTVTTRDAHPADWALTQENLAFAERARAQHPATTDPDPHWEAALRHVDAALEVFDPEHMSYDYENATTLRDKILARQ